MEEAHFLISMKMPWKVFYKLFFFFLSNTSTQYAIQAGQITKINVSQNEVSCNVQGNTIHNNCKLESTHMPVPGRMQYTVLYAHGAAIQIRV